MQPLIYISSSAGAIHCSIHKSENYLVDHNSRQLLMSIISSEVVLLPNIKNNHYNEGTEIDDFKKSFVTTYGPRTARADHPYASENLAKFF